MSTIWAVSVAGLIAVVLLCAYWFFAQGAAPSSPIPPEAHRRAAIDAGEGKAAVVLARAVDLGLRGWRPAAQPAPTKDHSELLVAGVEREAESLARTRPDLFVVRLGDGDDAKIGLAGMIAPRDREAIAVNLLIGAVHLKGIGDAPPDKDLRSMGDALAGAVELVGENPSASTLLGPGASEHAPQGRALVAAAAAWPSSVRAARVIPIPPDGVGMSGLRVELSGTAKLPVGVVQRLQRGPLRLNPTRGKWIIAQAAATYQNPQGDERYLSVRFLYDESSSQWVLFEICSLPSLVDAKRWVGAGNADEIGRNTYTIDLTSVLPDHLVTSYGILTERR